MKHVNVIRAWKDPGYRLSLSDAERAGLICELDPTELEQVMGGTGFFEGLLNKVLSWVNEGAEGSVTGTLVTAGKAIVATPAIATLAGAVHLEHVVTRH